MSFGTITFNVLSITEGWDFEAHHSAKIQKLIEVHKFKL